MSTSSDTEYIAKAWANYERDFMSPGLPRAQRAAMRKAFYAGATTVLGTLIAATKSTSDAGAGQAELHAILAELTKYWRPTRNEPS